MVMRRAAARCGEWAQHFSNASFLLKSTATILAVAMFVGDLTTASASLASAAAVVDMHDRFHYDDDFSDVLL